MTPAETSDSQRRLTLAEAEPMTDEQLAGFACAVCGEDSSSMVPVGWAPTCSQLFACTGMCAQVFTEER